MLFYLLIAVDILNKSKFGQKMSMSVCKDTLTVFAIYVGWFSNEKQKFLKVKSESFTIFFTK